MVDSIHEIQRLFIPPNESYFLFGPRGTGKSTLVSQHYPDALVLDFLNNETRRHYGARPERLLDVVRALPEGHTIVLDEVQRMPELLSLVHLLIEEKKNWQFVLTGSSARKLKGSGIDLLGGRALEKRLHPFLAAELGDYFNLNDALMYGLLPLRFASDNARERLSAYVSLYLEEEVKQEGLVRQLNPFIRFLEVLSFSHGSILNLSNIAREAAVKRTTAENWYSIIQDLLIAFEIPVFSRRAKRILSVQQKFYLFDVGVYRALRPVSILDIQSELDGSALESLVAQHLRAWVDYSILSHKLFFWRTKSGVEVDFIVFGEKYFYAIEVKNSQQVSSRDLRSLMEFGKDYPEATRCLIYRGKERMKIKDVLCVPANEFLLNMKPNEPLI